MNTPAVPPPTSLPDIWLAGFLNSGLGLGEAGRLMARSLEAAGVPFETHAWQSSTPENIAFSQNGTLPDRAKSPAEKHPGISLLSLNGDHLSSFIESGGRPLFDGRYVISVWFWELEELPQRMIDGFQYVDEVWAATPFIHDAIARHSPGIPVRQFAHPVNIPQGDAAAGRARFPFEDRFVFLFAFDYQSCAKRKNPEGVCRAFAEAFPAPTPGGPLCVIKSINATKHPVDHALIQHRWAHRPDIIFMDGFLSVADRDLLTWRADCCVSLHRSEGLGLTLMEGMVIGKPCIATAYSGNLDFMTEERGWLIPFTRVPVGQGSVHYPAHQIWAEPDISAAAGAMKEVASMSPEVQARALAGQEFVRTQRSPAACGAQMATLLAEASQRSPRARTYPVSARAAAYATLAALREKSPSASDVRPRLWDVPKALERLERQLIRNSREERKAISQTLAAVRQVEEQYRLTCAGMQNQIDLLSTQLTEVIAHLPPRKEEHPSA